MPLKHDKTQDEIKEITLGGRTYEILSFLQGEKSVKGDVMVERAKDMNAHLGKDDREHLLKHQDEIPAILRGEVVFVFTDDRPPGSPGGVYCVYWGVDRWVGHWDWLGDDWDGSCRVLRRKSSATKTLKHSETWPSIQFCIKCGEKLNHECK